MSNIVKINLLVADDHAVIRQGVAAILKGSDIQLVAEAETGNQAIEQAMKMKPDVSSWLIAGIALLASHKTCERGRRAALNT